MTNPLVLVGNAVLIAAALPATLFVLFYTRVRWEDTAMGRQTMAFSLVIALVLDLVVFRVLIGDVTWYALLRLLVFATIIPILWWRLWLLLTYQQRSLDSSPFKPTKGRIMEPTNEFPDALEGDLGSLGDEEYFEHLERAKAEDVHGVDPDGNRYEVDEGVQDLRGHKE